MLKRRSLLKSLTQAKLKFVKCSMMILKNLAVIFSLSHSKASHRPFKFALTADRMFLISLVKSFQRPFACA